MYNFFSPFLVFGPFRKSHDTHYTLFLLQLTKSKDVATNSLFQLSSHLQFISTKVNSFKCYLKCKLFCATSIYNLTLRVFHWKQIDKATNYKSHVVQNDEQIEESKVEEVDKVFMEQTQWQSRHLARGCSHSCQTPWKFSLASKLHVVVAETNGVEEEGEKDD